MQTLGLGLLGFDHLQLVYQTGLPATEAAQDSWFVIEGLRQPDVRSLRLGVEGWHGGTTLAEANGGAFADDLIDKIGTAQSRGSREIASGLDAPQVWATLVAHATDIEAQRFPYISFAMPSSPYPTINSSSLVGSLLFYAGIDITSALPFGTRFSPGTDTLIGSSGDDTLRTNETFTTVLGGDGNDDLSGTNDASRVDKLYGGKGCDRLHWSTGVNILHGGQPELPYESDGFDTVDYSGAGQITITASAGASQHWAPDFIVTFAGGEDRLYSIEQVVWNSASDSVVLSNGAKILESSLTITPDPGGQVRQGDTVDFSAGHRRLLINADVNGKTLVATESQLAGASSLLLVGVEHIIGSGADDRLYGSATTYHLDGGDGDDLVDAEDAGTGAPQADGGFAVEIDGGAGDDTLVSGPGRTLAHGGPGADVFVLGRFTAELVIADAEPRDRLYVPWRFAAAQLEPDMTTPRDLVIRVTGLEEDARHQALIRVVDFHDGDLGLHSDASGTATAARLAGPVHLPRALDPRPSLSSSIVEFDGGPGRPNDAAFAYRSDGDLDRAHADAWQQPPHPLLVDYLELEPLSQTFHADHAMALAAADPDGFASYHAGGVDHVFAGAADVT